MRTSDDENTWRPPLTKNGALKVELVPMPAGDNPWRTRADYVREQRRDTVRFWMMIASIAASILATTGTAAIAIVTIRDLL